MCFCLLCGTSRFVDFVSLRGTAPSYNCYRSEKTHGNFEDLFEQKETGKLQPAPSFCFVSSGWFRVFSMLTVFTPLFGCVNTVLLQCTGAQSIQAKSKPSRLWTQISDSMIRHIDGVDPCEVLKHGSLHRVFVDLPLLDALRSLYHATVTNQLPAFGGIYLGRSCFGLASQRSVWFFKMPIERPSNFGSTNRFS